MTVSPTARCELYSMSQKAKAAELDAAELRLESKVSHGLQLQSL